VTGITSNGSSMAMGYAHSCAKVIGGGLKCWGSNSNGQLSDGTVTYSSTPLESVLPWILFLLVG